MWYCVVQVRTYHMSLEPKIEIIMCGAAFHLRGSRVKITAVHLIVMTDTTLTYYG